MTPDWRQRLESAVSPLQHGVRPLEVGGYRPTGREQHRPARTAAVLVPVVDDVEPSIILTLRSQRLTQHAGQVSFPGGSADPGDRSAVHTALREAREEIALDSSQVTPLGFLDRLDTVSDYRILPVVGLIDGAPDLVADGVEVAEIFHLPMAMALDRDRYTMKTVERDGREYRIFRLDYEGRVIWGATAAILVNLANRMAGNHPLGSHQ